MEKSYHSSTIQRALNILNLFKEHKTLSFTEIQRLLGYNKTTLFRVLSTLQHNRYLSKDQSGRYQLGLNVFILGNRISAEYQLKKVAEPLMEELAERTELTVHLGILDGTNIIIIGKAEPNSMIQMVSRIGGSVPAHCTGQGKTLLAFSPKATVEKIINSKGLLRYTPQTITTADHLFAELANIRRLGFAIDNSEHEKNIRCVAVPILNETGKIEAALSITGTTTDFPGEETIKKYADMLMKVREEIRKEMGYWSNKNSIP
jgi:DNA-binding IclR family transcriptional regulator